jgi:hypothetical protein
MFSERVLKILLFLLVAATVMHLCLEKPYGWRIPLSRAVLAQLAPELDCPGTQVRWPFGATRNPTTDLMRYHGCVDSSGGLRVTFRSLSNMRFADQFPGATADVQITNALADLPASGGTVDARGYGATIQTIAAPLTIGSLTKSVDLLVDRSTAFEITITSGATAITVGATSGIIATGKSQTARTGFTLASNANIADAIFVSHGRGNAGFTLSGIDIYGNPTATVSGGMLHLSGPLQTTDIQAVTIVPNSNSYGLKIDQASAGQSAGPVNFYNLVVDGQARTGAKPVYINTPFTRGVFLGINFFGGSLAHAGNGQDIVKIDDTGGNFQDQGVNFFGTQFESSFSNTIGVECHNCIGLNMISNGFTAAVAGADCVRLSGTLVVVNLQNLNNQGAWTNTINDQIHAVTNTQTRVLSYMQTQNGNSTWLDNSGLRMPGTTFANLGTPVNGTMLFCSDCTIANPCAGAGTGALAKRLNGVWVCN